MLKEHMTVVVNLKCFLGTRLMMMSFPMALEIYPSCNLGKMHQERSGLMNREWLRWWKKWFLVEMGTLDVLNDEGTLSASDIYRKIAEDMTRYGCSWESFEVYRHLKNLVYNSPWSLKNVKPYAIVEEGSEEFDLTRENGSISSSSLQRSYGYRNSLQPNQCMMRILLIASLKNLLLGVHGLCFTSSVVAHQQTGSRTLRFVVWKSSKFVLSNMGESVSCHSPK